MSHEHVNDSGITSSSNLLIERESLLNMFFLENEKKRHFNCSQTQFIAIMLVPSFFNAIFRFTSFVPTLLTFCYQKRDKQVNPRGHQVAEQLL